MSHEDFMRQAIALARANIAEGGRPFGAVLARAANGIHRDHDPTAHAEMLAIRQAGQTLGTPRLEGSVVYASGHPCPMCLAAMHLCGIREAWFAYSNEEGEPFGLSTAAVYAALTHPPTEQPGLRLAMLRPADEDGLYTEWQQLAYR